jgi:serine/threonine protein kinase
VYQAADSKLGRSVAIKFLPEAFSHDSERVARFEREARVLASLNHSNIAAIFGLEESSERKFLVMDTSAGKAPPAIKTVPPGNRVAVCPSRGRPMFWVEMNVPVAGS